jgi:pimeloyl-ACP methyl ester carboxylesterase
VHSPASVPDIAAEPAGPETPFFFEHAGRPLFAVLHEPARPRPGAPVLLPCHSLGIEQLTPYRNEVAIARAAARLGFPALRWHARGCGDSAGDTADVTLASLLEDAHAAAEVAKRRTGATRTAWLGIRLGAHTAAAAAAARDDAAALAMWEPVERSQDYFRAMLRGMLFAEVAAGRKPADTVDALLARLERDGTLDVHGYLVYRELVASLRDTPLSGRLAGWARPTLIVQVQARPTLSPAHAKLAESLAAGGARVATVQVAEEPGWHFMANPSWLSEPLVRQTAEWLDAVA